MLRASLAKPLELGVGVSAPSRSEEQRRMSLVFQLCLLVVKAHCNGAVISPRSIRLHIEPLLLHWARPRAPQPSLSLGRFGLEGALVFTVCVCHSCSVGIRESFFSPSPHPPLSN